MAPASTSSNMPVMYSFRRCPYAMRARLALAVSGLLCEVREIALRNKPPELLAASAKGTVPVLVLPNGSVIDESLTIMRWALSQHDPLGWLAPGDAQLGLVAANDGLFKHHLDRYKYPYRFADTDRRASGTAYESFTLQHRNAGALWLTDLEAMLATSPDGNWLFQSGPSLADMAILPFVRQFAHTDATWFSAQPWSAVQGWLARFEASSLFAGVMEKHPLWQPVR